MTRGKIDLTGHSYHREPSRPPTRRQRRVAPIKCPDREYRQIWRLVDGAVRDALETHPEYLTAQGHHNARGSIVKRVAGAIYGHAAQAARGRSVAAAAASERKQGAQDRRQGFGIGDWCKAVAERVRRLSVGRRTLGGADGP